MQELRFSYKAKKKKKEKKKTMKQSETQLPALPCPSRGQVKKLAKLIFAFLASGLKLNSEAQQEVLSK